MARVQLRSPEKRRLIGIRSNYEIAKDRIVEKASELFSKSGYYGVTLSDIADSLRVSKSTIYRYFGEKEEILFEIHLRTHESMLEDLQKIAENGDSCENRLRQAIANHVRVASRVRSPTTGAILQEYALKNRHLRVLIRLRDRYDKMLRDIIEEGIEKGVLVKVDPKIMSFIMIGAANYTQHWYSSKGSLSNEEVVEIITDSLMRAVLSPTRV